MAYFSLMQRRAGGEPYIKRRSAIMAASRISEPTPPKCTTELSE
jgi:hypothetical protein